MSIEKGKNSMMRPILPKHNTASGVDSTHETPQLPEFRAPLVPGSSESSTSEAPVKPKRVVIPNACVPCRKRKSRCDGVHPCSKCIYVGHPTECKFDVENDHRRKGALRRENETLKRKNTELGEEVKRMNIHLDLISKCIASGNIEIDNVVKRLRRGEKFEDVANGIRSNTDINDSPGRGDYPDTSSPEADECDSGVDGGPGEGYDSLNMHRPCVLPSSWTNVTNDDTFIMELIDLYFTWHHPYFLFLSEQRFRADFSTGRLSNCSSLLVNAILATACQYSDRPEAREDANDEDSKGEHFWAEGKRIFERGGKRTITTIQALAIISVRESGVGRDLMGRGYMSLAYRLACDDKYNQILVPKQMQKNDIDDEAWRITFWGCYHLETVWNFGMRRLSEENKQVTEIEKPTPTNCTELAPWFPYTAHVPKEDLNPVGPCMVYEIFNELISLCQITEGITSWLYGHQVFKAGKLLEFHAKLKSWRDNLPKHLATVKVGDIPALFYLHCLHRTVALALFQPFIDLPFAPNHNFVSPLQLTNMHARELVQIIRMFRKSWGFRYCNNMIYQFLIPMCNSRQLEFPDPQAREDYEFGILGMREAGIAWPFGKIGLLSMVEIKDLPEETKKPSEELDQLLSGFGNLSCEEKTEMTQNSGYYAKIVENEFGRLAPDFMHHWGLEWVNFAASQPPPKVILRPTKKLSIPDLLNPR